MKNQKSLDMTLKQILQDWHVPGLAVGIVENQDIVFEKYYGYKRNDEKTVVDRNTRFCIASISKTFVATAIMKLFDLKLIYPEIRIIDILPDFRMNSLEYDQITVDMLLAHTSGIPDISEQAYNELLYSQDDDPKSLYHLVYSLKDLSLISKPGSEFHYSNIGYDILGLIIAETLNMSFEMAMRKLLFEPLLMHDSTFSFSGLSYRNLAWPHIFTPALVPTEYYPYFRGDAPSSFMHTTLGDMLKYLKMYLGEGDCDHQNFLSAKSIEYMAESAIARGYPPFYQEGARGFNVGYYNNVKVLSHGGMGFGWSDFMMIFPDRKFGAVIMCTQESAVREVIIEAIVKTFFEESFDDVKPSWIFTLNEAYLEGGKKRLVQTAKAIMAEASQNFIIDSESLVNIIYQLNFARNYQIAKEYLEAYIELYPQENYFKEMLKEQITIIQNNENG